jgi:ornithine cyclodeaminase/alanine dehydrogenase-like protein (mu-crystallin family)
MPAKVELSASSPWFLHAMPAIVPRMGAGVKWVSYNPTNRSQGRPNSSALLILNDMESGLPYCVLDALWATYARTAACAIVAIRRLAAKLGTVALVGGGQMATTILPYIDESFPELERFEVVTRSEESARAFCDALAPRLHATVRPARDVTQATAAADVVISAIGDSAEPPLEEHHFRRGMLALPLDAETAWTTAALHLADKSFADDPEVFANGFRRRRPHDVPPAMTGGLADVVAGNIAGREREDERILCSNNGIAILDVVLGAEIYRRAVAQGLGSPFPLTGD